MTTPGPEERKMEREFRDHQPMSCGCCLLIPVTLRDGVLATLDAEREARARAEKYGAPAAGAVALSGIKPCKKHNAYWTTAYGACMACRADEAEAKLAAAEQERDQLRTRVGEVEKELATTKEAARMADCGNGISGCANVDHECSACSSARLWRKELRETYAERDRLARRVGELEGAVKRNAESHESLAAVLSDPSMVTPSVFESAVRQCHKYAKLARTALAGGAVRIGGQGEDGVGSRHGR